ncbi:MAG: MarR family transcriptional regulator [Candidatus Heimdallarchaeota archaeon]|nr:MarR family transcriptional regulator [Candidatus Heimdallarchaeota archaeon]MCK5049553.1 MarR family transcriptional regulator [Candidatus Heimdallarchaeota archaeon]
MKTRSQGGFLISKIKQHSGRIFTKILKENNISLNSAQGRIMFVLWQNKQMTITDLVKETSLVKSTLTTMLGRLEKMDLIKKIADEEDRRKTQVTLTEKSKKMEKKYHSISEEMDAIYYKDFKKEEMDLFEQYLKRILSNLQNYEGK